MTGVGTIEAGGAATAAAPRLLTAEEHLRDHGDGRTELVRGRLVRKDMPGERHGEIAGFVYLRLINWGGPRGFKVMIEAGNVLARNPDTVRLPDVSAIEASKLPGGELAVGYGEVPLDVAVEVRSPDQTPRSQRSKLKEYAAAGTPLCWLVDPGTRTVEVFENGEPTATLTDADRIDGGTTLPGFACDVRLFFEVT